MIMIMVVVAKKRARGIVEILAAQEQAVHTTQRAPYADESENQL